MAILEFIVLFFLFCISLKNSIKISFFQNSKILFEKILSKPETHTHTKIQEEWLIFWGSQTYSCKGKLSASLTNLEMKLFTHLKESEEVTHGDSSQGEPN